MISWMCCASSPYFSFYRPGEIVQGTAAWAEVSLWLLLTGLACSRSASSCSDGGIYRYNRMEPCKSILSL
ncbi:hypothetical protein [Paenibacillus sp. FSL R10-2736]|uniref:hypothetical protein n=1 Tax=Paenibacillus sp. FSL R10-2736 TaxID=2954692 RepID=UPI0030FB831A